MKRQILLGVGMLALLPATLFAQSTHYPKWREILPKTVQSHSHEKLLVTNHRVVAETYKEWSGGAFQDGDSARYVYSGTRGGNYGGGYFTDEDVLAYDNATYLVKNGTQWDNSSKDEQVFDANNNLTLSTSYQWNGASWDNSYRYAYQYDANGNLTTQTSYSWDGANWVNSSRNIYTYNANNQELTSLTQFWTAGAWADNSRNTSTYNGQGQKTQTLGEVYNAGAWNFTGKDIYTYNGAGFLSEELNQYYSAGAWTSSSKTLYGYNAQNNITSYESQQWNAGAWDPSYKNLYQYNGALLTQSTTSEWVAGAWVPIDKILYTHNSFGLYKDYTSQDYVNNAWVNAYFGKLYYETYEDGTVGITRPTQLSTKAYPNPFKENVFLDYDSKTSGQTVLTVTNLLGAVVYTETRTTPAGAQSWFWNGADGQGKSVSNGVYLYTIQKGNEVAHGKIIKE